MPAGRATSPEKGGEMGRWTTTKKKRWKRKGSWGPADEAWGGVAWWKRPLECGFWRWWGRVGGEKRAGPLGRLGEEEEDLSGGRGWGG